MLNHVEPGLTPLAIDCRPFGAFRSTFGVERCARRSFSEGWFDFRSSSFTRANAPAYYLPPLRVFLFDALPAIALAKAGSVLSAVPAV